MKYLKKRKKPIVYVVLGFFIYLVQFSSGSVPLYGVNDGSKDTSGNPRVEKHVRPVTYGVIAKEVSQGKVKKKRSIWPFILGGAALAALVVVLLVKKKPGSDNNGTEGAITTSGWGSQGDGPGQFRFPAGICLDSAGNVYVSDYDNTRIQKFTANGEFIKQFGPPFYSYNDFKPGSSVIFNQTLYVCDGGGNSRVILFDLEGTFLDKWDVWVVGPGTGLNPYPSAISADNTGNIYVTEWYYQRIFKYNNQGLVVKTWGNGQGSALDQFDFPEGVAVVNNEVFVSDKYNKRIMIFDLGIHYLRHWNTYDDYRPYDIVLGWNNQLLIISKKVPGGGGSTVWASIAKYDLNGTHLGNAPRTFESPSAFAVNHQQRKIYVTDYETHSVIVIDAF